MSREDQIQKIIENIARCQRPSNAADWQRIGLSHAQVGMLYMLHFHKQLRVKQVADYLGITKSAASQMLDSLTDKGLVIRQPDTADRRIIRFSLSAKGTQSLKKLTKLKFSGMRSRLEALPSDDLAALAAISNKMASAQS
jgi:DNA-binding MarR family transcriptional regulator